MSRCVLSDNGIRVCRKKTNERETDDGERKERNGRRKGAAAVLVGRRCAKSPYFTATTYLYYPILYKPIIRLHITYIVLLCGTLIRCWGIIRQEERTDKPQGPHTPKTWGAHRNTNSVHDLFNLISFGFLFNRAGTRAKSATGSNHTIQSVTIRAHHTATRYPFPLNFLLQRQRQLVESVVASFHRSVE